MRVWGLCIRSAVNSAWRLRLKLVTVQAVLWLPYLTLFAVLSPAHTGPSEILLRGFVDSVWFGALLHLQRAEHRQQPIGVLGALRRSWDSFPRMVGLNAIIGVRIMLGLLLVVPGIILYVRYILTNTLAVCEDVGPTRCRMRSSLLVGPHFLGAASLVFIFAVIGALVEACAKAAVQTSNHLEIGIVLRFLGISLAAILPMTLFEFWRTRVAELLEPREACPDRLS